MERKKRKEKQGKDKKKERQVRQGKEKKRNERKVNKRKKEQYSSFLCVDPSLSIQMRQNLIFNVKVIEDSNRGFGLFRKGILKSKRPTGMSLCCLFTSATGYQAPPPIFY